jgi:peptidoglycan/xylan/chitin deacetylase (PgdA/CDA1 family)
MTATVLLTFDFDADSPWLQPGVEDAAYDLTQRSLGAYGARRGIHRILAMLTELELPATFFLPGWTTDAYPDRVKEIHAAGHEVGHHGYHHVPPVRLSEDAQREDLLRGLEAIERCTGERPLGYRSPSWQLTPTTLALLVENGFAYDSSCMGDDRPYVERHGEFEILELPVHWTLDDLPHLGWRLSYRGPLRDVGEVIATWRREVEAAITEQRPLVLTCHPEVIGRASPMAAFADFVRDLRDDGRVCFARCIDIARSLEKPAD